MDKKYYKCMECKYAYRFVDLLADIFFTALVQRAVNKCVSFCCDDSAALLVFIAPSRTLKADVTVPEHTHKHTYKHYICINTTYSLVLFVGCLVRATW